MEEIEMLSRKRGTIFWKPLVKEKSGLICTLWSATELAIHRKNEEVWRREEASSLVTPSRSVIAKERDVIESNLIEPNKFAPFICTGLA